MRRCGHEARFRIFRLEALESNKIMNTNRFLAALVFVASISLSTASAQPGTQSRPQAPATQTTNVAIPVSKVAVIYSEAFQDPKTGIARFNTLLTSLNREFQPRQTELDTMAKTIKALEDEITKVQSGTVAIDPKTVQAKIDQHDQMKKDYQRKGEDAQAAYQKRRNDLFGPLQEEVGKALDTFAKARGITIILDASQVQGILFAADSIDITKAFITDYNSKNPATAAVTPPKP
jgi:Skp family chaperone for outer membrane proteins